MTLLSALSLLAAETALKAAHAAAAHSAHAVAPVHASSVPWLFLVPLFPLVGAAVNALFGLRLQRAFGKRAVHAVAVGAMLLSCLAAEVAFWKMFALPAEGRSFQDTLWNMWTSGALKVDLGFYLDPLSMVMTMIVTHVATLIHIYSVGYMADD